MNLIIFDERVTAGGHRMMPTIEGALASGEYDAILGDRPRWADSVVILFACGECVCALML